MNKKFLLLGLLGLNAFSTAGAQVYTKKPVTGETPCSEAKMKELSEPATAAKSSIKLNCTMYFKTPASITKQVVFAGVAASGATLDCAGGTISPASLDALLIYSKVVTVNNVKTWERPENVTIRNCKIKGGLRVHGMARNGEGEDLRESSRRDAKHTDRAQANAPKNILLDKIRIDSDERIALYVSPGVTYLTLKNSTIRGSSALAVYLDAESEHNSFLNNNIDTSTPKRELFAIDGSANNIIQGNKFSSLANGGIYIYRNCGEGGTIRHQEPRGNQIKDNIFFYKNYKGSNPSVFIGSRNGNKKYCGYDNGFQWGSSKNDNDVATNNTVTGNKIYVRSVKDMIVSSYSNNVINSNYSVTAETVNTVGQPAVAPKPVVVVAPVVNKCETISGSCKYDVGTYRDGQRGGVKGYYKRDNKCNYSVRVTASYNGADSGFVSGKSVQIIGDRNYRYTSKISNNEFIVTSSGGQEVCQVNL